MWRYVVTVPLLMAAIAWAGSETRKIENLEFDQVLVYGDVDVKIWQQDETEVFVRGEADKLDQQPFFVSGDTLVIGRTKAHRPREFRNVQFKVAMPHLRHLQLKGSGEVYVKPFTADELFVSLQGSGDIKLFDIQGEEVILRMSGSGDIQAAEIVSDSLEAMVSGSGDIDLGEIHASKVLVTVSGSGDITGSGDGQCESLEINVVGSGDVDFPSLSSDDLEVNIVGSGSARVGQVSTSLDAVIMGSGDIYYSGEPEVDRTIIGSGQLSHR